VKPLLGVYSYKALAGVWMRRQCSRTLLLLLHLPSALLQPDPPACEFCTPSHDFGLPYHVLLEAEGWSTDAHKVYGDAIEAGVYELYTDEKMPEVERDGHLVIHVTYLTPCKEGGSAFEARIAPVAWYDAAGRSNDHHAPGVAYWRTYMAFQQLRVGGIVYLHRKAPQCDHPSEQLSPWFGEVRVPLPEGTHYSIEALAIPPYKRADGLRADVLQVARTF
jgi:hypothetical protein